MSNEISVTTNLGAGIETLLEGLKLIQESIRFADTKAGLIVAFHVAIFGVMATQVDAFRTVAIADYGSMGFWLRVVFLGSYGICAIIAFIYAVACIFPRTGENAPPCLFHATHVARHYKRNYGQYCEDLAKTDAKT